MTIDRQRQYHIGQFQPKSSDGANGGNENWLIRDTLLFLVSMDLPVQGDEIFVHSWGFVLELQFY